MDIFGEAFETTGDGSIVHIVTDPHTHTSD